MGLQPGRYPRGRAGRGVRPLHGPPPQEPRAAGRGEARAPAFRRAGPRAHERDPLPDDVQEGPRRGHHVPRGLRREARARDGGFRAAGAGGRVLQGPRFYELFLRGPDHDAAQVVHGRRARSAGDGAGGALPRKPHSRQHLGGRRLPGPSGVQRSAVRSRQGEPQDQGNGRPRLQVPGLDPVPFAHERRPRPGALHGHGGPRSVRGFRWQLEGAHGPRGDPQHHGRSRGLAGLHDGEGVGGAGGPRGGVRGGRLPARGAEVERLVEGAQRHPQPDPKARGFVLAVTEVTPSAPRGCA
mmetsp:Transcript_45884/g.133572  ORF Transcript_45884/g.133572 Transcript_45884/m.133572 type:complete len:297 (+) Transcript_45884:213-1103(+)